MESEQKMIFANIRRSKRISLWKKLINPILMLLLGLMTGVVIMLLDLFTTNLGNVFSELTVWIMIGVCISIFSASPWRAGINLFVYSIGMLTTYYITAELLGTVWGKSFAYVWAAFALILPILAFVTWYAKGRGFIAGVLRIGIIAVMLISANTFSGFRFYDVVIIIITAIMLFTGNKSREKN